MEEGIAREEGRRDQYQPEEPNRVAPRSTLLRGLAGGLALLVASLVVLDAYDVIVIHLGGEGGLAAFSLMLQIFVWMSVFLAGCICGHLWPRMFLRELPRFLMRRRAEPAAIGIRQRISLAVQAVFLIVALLFFYASSMSAGYTATQFMLYALTVISMLFGFAFLINTSFFAFAVLIGTPFLYMLAELVRRVLPH